MKAARKPRDITRAQFLRQIEADGWRFDGATLGFSRFIYHPGSRRPHSRRIFDQMDYRRCLAELSALLRKWEEEDYQHQKNGTVYTPPPVVEFVVRLPSNANHQGT